MAAIPSIETAVMDAVEAARITMTTARTGVISLVRTATRASLARVLGGINLVRTDLRATMAFLRCHCHQGEIKTTTKMMGLGDFKSLMPSLTS